MAIASCAVRFADLQLDSAEYMGMPAANPKHVFIIRETFNISRLQTSAGQQKFRLAVKNGNRNQIFVHAVHAASARAAVISTPSGVALPAKHHSLWAGNIPRGGVEGHRRILGRDADNGAIEMVKSFFIYDGRNFSGDASGARVFVQNNNLAGFAHGLSNGFAIQRRQACEGPGFRPRCLPCLTTLQPPKPHAPWRHK